LVDALAGPWCNTVNAQNTCVAYSPLTGSRSTIYESKIDWFGTVRGRVGWLLNDQTLLYATGGLAYGNVSVSGSTALSARAFFVSYGPNASSFGASETRLGFTVGGGIEGRLTALLPPGWTWKLEYLYVDLGSLDVATTITAISNFPIAGSNLTGTSSFSTRFTDNIVRFGLNYKFGP
jgi:outer membrane immunogenic protein